MGKSEKSGGKGRLIKILIVLLALAGAAILVYPTLSNEWNTLRQKKLITNYSSTLADGDSIDVEALWEAAREYNDSLGKTNVYTDAFEGGEEDLEGTEYWQVLNVTGNGVMGYISIPKINQRIPIYHGTSDEVLKIGVGHLSGSQLPIGGGGNHAVLAAHRGLPSAKLFSDLDQLEIGDQFYLYILDEVLAYEVDQILPMVEKDDVETLSGAMQSVEGEDYVTLFTCTPYGVNTHRLLVRGHRVPYVEEETTFKHALIAAIINYYMLFLLAGIAATVLGILAARRVILRKPDHEKED